MGEQLLQQILNWLTLGSTYALIALGFSLLFGVLKVIHFSHGDVSLVAPFIALATIQGVVASTSAELGAGSLLLGCVVAIIMTGFLGVLLDVLVIRRFRTAPAMMALVATVALGIVLRELVRHIFPNGSNPQAFPQFLQFRVEIPGGAEIPAFSLFAIATSTGAVAVLYFILQHTALGMRIRAVSQDSEAARLMAIDPRRIFFATFFVSSALGAVGGLFFASYAGVVRFDFGVQAGLIGFSAAVVGGLGSMSGAIIGSLLIAGLDTVIQATVPNGASYRLVFAFLLVILVLVFKPSGLFGRVAIEKV